MVKETYPSERRVALVPGVLPSLAKKKIEAVVEAGAGDCAGFPDGDYAKQGAKIASRREVFEQADVVVQVRTLGANVSAGVADLGLMREGQVIIGFAEPLAAIEPLQQLASHGLRVMAMELMPRTTRAQAMDALSSQATVQGYKAVLLAASHLPKMFPMMMTAAGTIAPAKVFIIGAGVAGLQAIATSRKLGGVVSAYDVRPVVKEQVQSLGARFLELPLEASGAQDKGGYATAMDDTFIRKQQELMSDAVAGSDVVITTAAVPGKKSPVLVTGAAVERMKPGSVIVDLAAERGGNCELSRPDQVYEHQGVTILAPTNLAATVPHDASQMYARNIAALLQLIANKEGALTIDTADDIVEGTLVSDGGRIVHRRLCEIFQLEAPAMADAGGANA